MFSAEFFLDYQRKKVERDSLEALKASANTKLAILTYQHFGCSGPITPRQKKEYLKKQGYSSYKEYEDYYLGHFDPIKERNMNENNHELVGDADTVATLLAANNGLPHADANLPFDPSDGEAAHEEGAFIGEDTSDIVAN